MTTIRSADLNRAIAQLCGVKPVLRGYYVCLPNGSLIVMQSEGRGECEDWLAEQRANGKPHYEWCIIEDLVWPDYCSSVDTCHEAEKALTHAQVRLYIDALWNIVGNTTAAMSNFNADQVGSFMWRVHTASPRHRAEALYAVLGRREGGA